MGPDHYNSTRLPDTDKLDSSPLRFVLQLSDAALTAIRAEHQSTLRSRRSKSSSSPSSSSAAALDDALTKAVSCEILYWDGSLPLYFCEDPEGTEASRRMSAVPQPALKFTLDQDARELTVMVDRKFPLSSSHGNRRFILSFLVGPDVLTTQAFIVYAKKGRAGTTAKWKYKNPVIPVSDRRASALSAMRAALGLASTPVDALVSGDAAPLGKVVGAVTGVCSPVVAAPAPAPAPSPVAPPVLPESLLTKREAVVGGDADADCVPSTRAQKRVKVRSGDAPGTPDTILVETDSLAGDDDDVQSRALSPIAALDVDDADTAAPPMTWDFDDLTSGTVPLLEGITADDLEFAGLLSPMATATTTTTTTPTASGVAVPQPLAPLPPAPISAASAPPSPLMALQGEPGSADGAHPPSFVLTPFATADWDSLFATTAGTAC